MYKILIFMLFATTVCDKPVIDNPLNSDHEQINQTESISGNDHQNHSKDEEQDIGNEENEVEISVEDQNNKERKEPEETPGSTEVFLYIGTYTDGGSKGIYVAKFNSKTGEISTPELAATITNPSFQTITPDKRFLWSVSEAWGSPGRVYAYEIDPTNGKLKQVSNLLSSGDAPCYVSYHTTTRNILVANYNTGNVANLPVTNEGISAGETYSDQHVGSGPNNNRQKGPHAHCIKTDIDGRYIYSANLGTDKVYVYSIENNHLKRVSEIELEPGSGPRHIDFHPSGKAMAVINELNSTISLFGPDNHGILNQMISSTSTIPVGFTDNNQCADIHYSPDGKFLYASNRGHNSIAIFKVNEDNMEIETVEKITETINWPRNFIIDKSGRFLIVANQNNNSITVFERNLDNGKLKYTGNKLSISKPVCVTLLHLNE